jgi:YidC/Oxa1 family membrane protein insertase
MQAPIFCFISILSFGNKFETKGFLWADDLSSFDSIYELPFHVPLYGNHISLFPILASIAIFFYENDNRRSTNGSSTQEGMPDMAKMMKIMIYVSPLMMLFFFNSYASD